MKLTSFKGKITSRYRELEIRHGMDLMGLAVMGAIGLDLLAEGPLAQVCVITDGRKRFKAPLEVMGQFIVHGLAKFVPEKKHYEITPEGMARALKLRELGLVEAAKAAKREMDAYQESEVAA